MRKLYKGLSIDAAYQVSVHLVKWFQRRRFLEIDQSETRIACGGHVCFNESGRNEQSL
jgi:N-acetylglutamate synthase-like GNAT family acetyltransferase